MNEPVNKRKLEIPQYDGGATIIDRFKAVFGVQTRAQLTDYIGLSTGGMSTWQTRNTTPFEVVCRVSLATGARLEWLLFGRGEMYEEQQALKTGINLLKTDNGHVISEQEFSLNDLAALKPAEVDGVAIELGQHTYFVDPSKTDASQAGKYLISINGVHQVGELRQLPDGVTYYIEGADRYPINLDVTKVIGKVTGELTRT